MLCEYLYAQFSLKRATSEGITADQLVRVRAWEQVLVDIAKQEMLHLALATNILTAVGAAPHFERPNFPILSRWYPPDVQIALVGFGERALATSCTWSGPKGCRWPTPRGCSHAGRFEPLTADDAQLTAGRPGVEDRRTPVSRHRGGAGASRPSAR